MHVRRSYTADNYTSLRTFPESECVDAENVRALTFRAGEMALSERKGVRLAACLHEKLMEQLGIINTKKIFTVKALYSALQSTSVQIRILQPIRRRQIRSQEQNFPARGMLLGTTQGSLSSL